jgi:hypothetical protein
MDKVVKEATSYNLDTNRYSTRARLSIDLNSNNKIHYLLGNES